MGKKKNTYIPWMQNNPQDKHFFMMYDGMIMSAAYSKLSNNAKAIYNLLRANLYDSGNSSKCPYSDISKYTGVHRSYIRGCIDELIAFGFIKVKDDVKSTKRGVGKPSNVYEFIDKWKDVDSDKAKEIKKDLAKKKDFDVEKKAKSKERIEKMKAEKTE